MELYRKGYNKYFSLCKTKQVIHPYNDFTDPNSEVEEVIEINDSLDEHLDKVGKLKHQNGSTNLLDELKLPGGLWYSVIKDPEGFDHHIVVHTSTNKSEDKQRDEACSKIIKTAKKHIVYYNTRETEEPVCDHDNIQRIDHGHLFTIFSDD